MIHLITVISVFLLEVGRRSVSHSLLRPHMLTERHSTRCWVLGLWTKSRPFFYAESLSSRNVLEMTQGETCSLLCSLQAHHCSQGKVDTKSFYVLAWVVMKTPHMHILLSISVCVWTEEAEQHLGSFTEQCRIIQGHYFHYLFPKFPLNFQWKLKGYIIYSSIRLD